MRNSLKQSLLNFRISPKPFMTKTNNLNDKLLMQKLSNGGQTNLYEWFEKNVDELYEEQAIEECTSFDEIKYIFHDEFHEIFVMNCPYPII